MRPKLSFSRYIGHDRKQLDVNKASSYESYACTCFHSQQLAEKTLKQRLLDFGADNAPVHSLMALAKDLAYLSGYNLNGRGTHDLKSAISELSRFYTRSRYPIENTADLHIDESTAARSIEQADAIVNWANSLVVPCDGDESTMLAIRLAFLKMSRMQASGFDR